MLDAERKPWADMARGFAIVTVVFFHVALSLDTVGQIDWRVWLLVNLFAPIPIALFFFVSGLFGRSVVAGGWGGGLGRRLGGLLYAFTIWSIIEACLKAAVTGVLPRPDLSHYLIDPQSTLWFVWALAIFTFGAHLLWRRWPRLTLSASVVISALSYCDLIVVDSFVYENLLRFACFFLLGLSAPSLEAIVSRRRWLIFGLGSVVYAALAAVATFAIGPDRAGLVLAIMTWLSIPTAIAGCMLTGSLPGPGRVIRWLGKNSLGIYLGHPVAILLLIASLASVWRPGGEPLFLAVFVLTVPALFASAALYWLAVRTGATILYNPPLGDKASRRPLDPGGDGSGRLKGPGDVSSLG